MAEMENHTVGEVMITEEQIRAECRREIDAYKKNGGFILSTGCEYPAQLPDHYARVIVEEARTYGKY